MKTKRIIRNHTLLLLGALQFAPLAALHAAEPFTLSEVKLLNGPFLDAQERNKGYVLRVDVDKLMHWFRVRNGLPSSAQPYSEWKETDYGQQGHYQGHYLSACAEMFQSTGDVRFKERLGRVVSIMAECQAKQTNGYVSVFPERWMRHIVGVEKYPDLTKRLPVPWYALHKVYQGLLDAYTMTGNQQALDIMNKVADWAYTLTEQSNEASLQKMLDDEHGGINEAFANLYAITHNPKHLSLAKRFCHKRVMEPLAKGEDTLDHLHANTQVPKFTGFARVYEQCGETLYRDAALHFWTFVVNDRSYANGGNSSREHFTPKKHLSASLSSGNCETCNTHNMLKLTRSLLTQSTSAKLGDYYEKALLNHILSSQSPESGTVTYFHGLEGGSRKGFGPSWPNFGCCHASGMENHAKYGDSIYFKQGKERLYVNLFIASEVNWKEAGIRVKQTTVFPEEQKTLLTITADQPAAATIMIRKPSWVGKDFDVRVNNQAVKTEQADGWCSLSRTWKSGDVIHVSLAMSLRWEAFKDNSKRAALMYGPVLLVAKSEEGCRLAAVSSPLMDALRAIKKTNRPLCFEGDAKVFHLDMTEKPVLLKPLYQTVRDFYSVYWDEQDESQRQEAQRAYAREEKRWHSLAPKTVDVAFPGMATAPAANNIPGRFASLPQAPKTPGSEHTEQQHALEAQVGYNSELNLIQWQTAGLSQTFRTLEKGMGLFGWTLAIEPGKPQRLLVRLWSPSADDPEAKRATECGLDVRVAAFSEVASGNKDNGVKKASETDGNQFAVDAGKKPADKTQSLGAIGPAPATGSYRDVEFPLPESLTKGNNKLLVRFVRKGGTVPGLVGEVRVVRE